MTRITALSPRSLGSTAEDERIEQLLSERVLQGCVLLERPCPQCRTPLIQVPSSNGESEEEHPDDEDDDDDNVNSENNDDRTPILVPSFTDTVSTDDGKFEPVPGIPYCVCCQAHVIRDKSQVSKLMSASNKAGSEWMLARKGAVLVATPSQHEKEAASVNESVMQEDWMIELMEAASAMTPLKQDESEEEKKEEVGEVNIQHVNKNVPSSPVLAITDTTEFIAEVSVGGDEVVDNIFREGSCSYEEIEVVHYETDEDDMQTDGDNEENRATQHDDTFEADAIIDIIDESDDEGILQMMSDTIEAAPELNFDSSNSSEDPVMEFLNSSLEASKSLTTQKTDTTAELSSNDNAAKTNPQISRSKPTKTVSDKEGEDQCDATRNTDRKSSGTSSSEEVHHTEKTPASTSPANSSRVSSQSKTNSSRSGDSKISHSSSSSRKQSFHLKSSGWVSLNRTKGGDEKKAVAADEKVVQITGKKNAQQLVASDEAKKEDGRDEDYCLPEYSVRRHVAAKVLGTKMLQGYILKEVLCTVCEMPLMSRLGHDVMTDCVVCPVLKRMANSKNAKEAINAAKNSVEDEPVATENAAKPQKSDSSDKSVTFSIAREPDLSESKDVATLTNCSAKEVKSGDLQLSVAESDPFKRLLTTDAQDPEQHNIKEFTAPKEVQAGDLRLSDVESNEGKLETDAQSAPPPSLHSSGGGTTRLRQRHGANNDAVGNSAGTWISNFEDKLISPVLIDRSARNSRFEATSTRSTCDSIGSGRNYVESSCCS